MTAIIYSHHDAFREDDAALPGKVVKLVEIISVARVRTRLAAALQRLAVLLHGRAVPAGAARSGIRYYNTMVYQLYMCILPCYDTMS